MRPKNCDEKDKPLRMDATAASFQNRADPAAFWEAWVGAVLARAGLYTLHHPFVVDGGDYHAHTWDLDVGLYAPGGLIFGREDVTRSTSLRSVEVKSLSVSFTRPLDYPFTKLLICSQSSWTKKWPSKFTTQRDFLFVSRPTGAIVWLPTGNEATLGNTITDKKRGETYKVVQTDKGNLRTLGEFVESIKEG